MSLPSSVRHFSLLMGTAAACGGPEPDPLEEPSIGEEPAAEPAPAALAVVLGTGADSFAALEDGAEIEIVLGPQGGAHVWGAVRVEGLPTDRFRAGFRLEHAEDGAVHGEVGPLLTLGTGQPEPGWTELVGVTVFLTTDPGRLDGSDCRLSVEIDDRQGGTARAERRVTPRVR